MEVGVCLCEVVVVRSGRSGRRSKFVLVWAVDWGRGPEDLVGAFRWETWEVPTEGVDLQYDWRMGPCIGRIILSNYYN